MSSRRDTSKVPKWQFCPTRFYSYKSFPAILLDYIVGCEHGCWFCPYRPTYIQKYGHFVPTLRREKLLLLKLLKTPQRVWVCPQSDLFALFIPSRWRELFTARTGRPCYRHLTFEIITRNPVGIPYHFRPNYRIGVRVATQADMSLVRDLVESYQGFKYVLFDPLLEPIDPAPYEKEMRQISWVILGWGLPFGWAVKKLKMKAQPEFAKRIVEMAKELKIPIFIKNNLHYPEEIKQIPVFPGWEQWIKSLSIKNREKMRQNMVVPPNYEEYMDRVEKEWQRIEIQWRNLLDRKNRRSKELRRQRKALLLDNSI